MGVRLAENLYLSDKSNAADSCAHLASLAKRTFLRVLLAIATQIRVLESSLSCTAIVHGIGGFELICILIGD